MSSLSTIGNYDYGFFWYLHADGSITYEVKLTGVVATGAVAAGGAPRTGTLVAPGLHGPHHLHFFNVRLDVAVDGARNTVVELDSVAEPPGPGTPRQRPGAPAHALREDGGRLADPATPRSWLVINEWVHNALGEPVGFQLLPGPAAPPLFTEACPRCAGPTSRRAACG